jgi:UDP-glucose 4-epimerase
MKEQTPPQPEDPYGIAKYAVERDLLAAHNMFGLNSIIFRPHNVYGPHQNIGDKYRNVVGIFMNQILQNKPLTIFGTGEQERAFTYIDDVAPYIAASINHPKAYNHIFNIGSSVVSSVNDLATKVNEAMHSNQKVRYLEKREEVLHAYADHTKFNRIFNPSASTTLSKGLEKTAAWVKKHGARTSTEFNAIELTKNLPESWSKAVSNE